MYESPRDFEPMAILVFNEGLPCCLVYCIVKLLRYYGRHCFLIETQWIRNWFYDILWHLAGRMPSPIRAGYYHLKILHNWRGSIFCGGLKYRPNHQILWRGAKVLKSPSHDPKPLRMCPRVRVPFYFSLVSKAPRGVHLAHTRQFKKVVSSWPELLNRMPCTPKQSHQFLSRAMQNILTIRRVVA